MDKLDKHDKLFIHHEKKKLTPIQHLIFMKNKRKNIEGYSKCIYK